MRLLGYAIYAAASVAFVLLVNEQEENFPEAAALWIVVSLLAALLGAGWRVLVIWGLAFLFALPFDYADEYASSDSLHVAGATLWAGIGSALAVGLGLALRNRLTRRGASDETS